MSAIAAVLGFAALTATITRLRSSWALVSASAVAAVGTVLWSLLMIAAATPCGLAGRGVLQSTAACPVQAIHYASALIGVASCLALCVGIIAALAYAVDQEPRTRRVFQVALLAAAILVLLWLGSNVILPRNHASD